MAANNALTWKWLAGLALTILLAGGGAWGSAMIAQVNRVQEEQKQDRKAVGEIDKKAGIIEERTKRIQEDIKELKEGQKDQFQKLDELLRRTR